MESQLSGPLSVCSFNMGSSVTDYIQLFKYKRLQLQFKTREEENDFFRRYADIQKVTAQILMQGNCDVYCLQEVGDEKRSLVAMLKEKNYRIIHIENEMFDAAIAISQERFGDIINLSHHISLTPIFKKDVAMASAVDRQTGSKLVFVSGHVPGFNFANPLQEEVAEGDDYCKAISDRLAGIAGAALHIIGADMNGSPEIAKKRFQVFLDTGFEVCRTRSPTNIHMEDADRPERELDFILVKNEEKNAGFLSKLMSPFQKKKDVFKAVVAPKSLLSWDPEQNSSDHLPLCVTIVSVKE